MSLAAVSVRQIIDNHLRNVSPINQDLLVHHVKQTIYLSKDSETLRLCYEYCCLAWVDSACCHLFCADVDFLPVTLSILHREYRKQQNEVDYSLQNWILLLLEMISDTVDQRHPHSEEIHSFVARNFGIIGAGLAEMETVTRVVKLILLLSDDPNHLLMMSTTPIKLLNSSLVPQLVDNLQVFLDHLITSQKRQSKVLKLIEMLVILLYRCCQLDELRGLVAEQLLVVGNVRLVNRQWRLLPTIVVDELDENEVAREYAIGILKQIGLVPAISRVLMDPRHVQFTQAHLPEVFDYFSAQRIEDRTE